MIGINPFLTTVSIKEQYSASSCWSTVVSSFSFSPLSKNAPGLTRGWNWGPFSMKLVHWRWQYARIFSRYLFKNVHLRLISGVSLSSQNKTMVFSYLTQCLLIESLATGVGCFPHSQLGWASANNNSKSPFTKQRQVKTRHVCRWLDRWIKMQDHQLVIWIPGNCLIKSLSAGWGNTTKVWQWTLLLSCNER